MTDFKIIVSGLTKENKQRIIEMAVDTMVNMPVGLRVVSKYVELRDDYEIIPNGGREP